MSAAWSESADIAAQVDDANQAARDDVMQQRHTDWIDIYDERQPTAAELDEQYWVYEQRAREWWQD